MLYLINPKSITVDYRSLTYLFFRFFFLFFSLLYVHLLLFSLVIDDVFDLWIFNLKKENVL